MTEVFRSATRNTGKTANAQSFRRTLCASSRAVLALAACLSSTVQNIGYAKAADAESKPPVTVCESGAVIAAQGTARSPACAACHAFDGSADGTGAFPRITGLPAEYIEAQMRDFASGLRSNAIMSPIARDLRPAEISCAAAYYASTRVSFPPLKSEDPARIKLGEQLASAGDAAKGIPACDACHGPQGNGQPGTAPYIGGQYAQYIAFTLHMWQRGHRKNSPGLMETFARSLDDQQIDAVAAYYQQAPASAAAAAQK
jgi:cytochrome c553